MTASPSISTWRRRAVAALASGATLLAAGGTFITPKLLLWNATASVPEGLYWIAHDRKPKVGELAVARLPGDTALLASQRHYLPLGVPLLKPVAASASQIVCRNINDVSVDGRVVARAADQDHLGRPLPHWTGCVPLNGRRLLLLNAAVPTSFDGRYFGPTDAKDVIGRAIPLFTRAAAGLPYRWRLPPDFS